MLNVHLWVEVQHNCNEPWSKRKSGFGLFILWLSLTNMWAQVSSYSFERAAQFSSDLPQGCLEFGALWIISPEGLLWCLNQFCPRICFWICKNESPGRVIQLLSLVIGLGFQFGAFVGHREGLLNLTIFYIFYVNFNTRILFRSAMDISTYTSLSFNTNDQKIKWIWI